MHTHASFIPAARLHWQRIAQPDLDTATSVATWMGALQAQDYAMCKWAIGLRAAGLTDEDVTAALDGGALVRTHVLRPTWHVVPAADVRWMLSLTGQRIKASAAVRDRDLGLDSALYRRANDLMAAALEGGNHLSREELMAALERGGIATNSSRAVHFMMNAETDGLVCNGPLRGKTHTYALLDERVPPAPAPTREEALCTLAKRYFTSHAPATLADFAWWSGLSMPDARTALESAKGSLQAFEADGRTFFAPPDMVETGTSGVHLLAAFDEYCVSYKDRNAVFQPEWQGQAITSNGIFKPIVVVNGMVEGIWKRTVVKDQLLIEISFFRGSPACSIAELEQAAAKYGSFMGLPVCLKVVSV